MELFVHRLPGGCFEPPLDHRMSLDPPLIQFAPRVYFVLFITLLFPVAHMVGVHALVYARARGPVPTRDYAPSVLTNVAFS